MAASPTSPSPAAAPDEGLDRELLLVAATVVVGAVMTILDTTVVNVAIRTLAEEFDSPLATIQWVATGYTLALATVIPLTGWAAERFGTKRLYLTSITLFLVGSMLSGIASSSTELIVFRVLQGLGGGMLMPAGMTILTRAAGPQRVGRVMAIMGVPMMLGPIAGPILGGWLVDDFSWRWIFFINVPVGIVALALTARVLPRDVPQPGHRLDWLGLGLLSPGLALLIYGLAKTSTEGGFGSAAVLVPMALGVVALAAFVAHARHAGEDALIDLRLFANKTFSAAAGTMILVIIAVFGGMLLLPLYLQAVRGESAMASGLLLAPQGIGAMLAMPIAGNLADRTGIGRIVPGGLVLVGVTFLGLTQLEADTSYWLFGVDLFFMGIGMGMTMMPTFSGAMQTLSQAAIPKASTTLNINQQVGASIGTAVLSVLLAHQLEGAGSPAAQADAYGSTFIWAFVLVAVAFVVALVLLPREKPAAPADPGATAHVMA